MDFTEISKFRSLYKRNTRQFSLGLDHNEIRTKRLTNRDKILFGNRNIELVESSPTSSPKSKKIEGKKNDRRQMLERWKKDKQSRLKQEKAKQKPVFKLSAVANVGFPELNKKVNAKPSKSKTTEKSFAPKNHQFRAPTNIKSISMSLLNTSKQTKTKQQPQPNKPKSQIVTRSRIKSIPPPVSVPATKIVKENKVSETKNLKVQYKNKPAAKKSTKEQKEVQKPTTRVLRSKKSSAEVQKIQTQQPNHTHSEEDKVNSQNSDECKSISPIYSEQHNSSLDNTIFTDESEKLEVYISPFVTTKRGKGSVKKENKERFSRGVPAFLEHSTTDELNNSIRSTSTSYFHTVLNNEISRLQTLCEKWNIYKGTKKLSDYAIDMIDVAVGQATLLINKKFQQFRGLIVNCQNGTGEKPVTCEDLQGFWDMVYMQVENLDIRFNRLIELRNNNWEEVLPQITRKEVKKKAPIKVKAKNCSSNIRAAILAARNKSKNISAENDDPASKNVFNGGFFVVQSPEKISLTKSPAKKTPSNNRRSLLATVLTANSERKLKKHLQSSPGIAMMKATNVAKSLEDITAKCNTPVKSILKTSRFAEQKTTSLSKVVLFQEHDLQFEQTFEKQVSRASTGTKIPRPSKKSLRLSKVALFQNKENVDTFELDVDETKTPTQTSNSSRRSARLSRANAVDLISFDTPEAKVPVQKTNSSRRSARLSKAPSDEVNINVDLFECETLKDPRRSSRFKK